MSSGFPPCPHIQEYTLSHTLMNVIMVFHPCMYMMCFGHIYPPIILSYGPVSSHGPLPLRKQSLFHFFHAVVFLNPGSSQVKTRSFCLSESGSACSHVIPVRPELTSGSLFQPAWLSLIPSIFLRAAGLCPSLWLNKIPLWHVLSHSLAPQRICIWTPIKCPNIGNILTGS